MLGVFGCSIVPDNLAIVLIFNVFHSYVSLSSRLLYHSTTFAIGPITFRCTNLRMLYFMESRTTKGKEGNRIHQFKAIKTPIDTKTPLLVYQTSLINP